MKYSILFGGNSAVNFDNSNDFESVIAISTGIQAVQKSNENKTITFRSNDEELPEDVRGDWMKIAKHLVELEVETPQES